MPGLLLANKHGVTARGISQDKRAENGTSLVPETDPDLPPPALDVELSVRRVG